MKNLPQNNDPDSQREFHDRRINPTPIISRYTFWGGRRKTVRRGEDKRKHVFVDIYSSRLLAAIIIIMCLSCADAFFTLMLIGDGKVVEANPIMAYVLEYGIMTFTLTKFFITASALIILCLFKNVRITRIWFPIAIKIYILVIAYEFYLMMI
ncbi:hypothetical protein H8E50_03705 [bacterium]|nr:hypothetical protein [bacterium]